MNDEIIYSGKSLYFTLISFTTIGFGDVVPNENNFILFAFLLFIGLALVSTVLNLIQQQIEALATVSSGGLRSKINNPRTYQYTFFNEDFPVPFNKIFNILKRKDLYC